MRARQRLTTTITAYERQPGHLRNTAGPRGRGEKTTAHQFEHREAYELHQPPHGKEPKAGRTSQLLTQSPNLRDPTSTQRLPRHGVERVRGSSRTRARFMPGGRGSVLEHSPPEPPLRSREKFSGVYVASCLTPSAFLMLGSSSSVSTSHNAKQPLQRPTDLQDTEQSIHLSPSRIAGPVSVPVSRWSDSQVGLFIFFGQMICSLGVRVRVPHTLLGQAQSWHISIFAASRVLLEHLHSAENMDVPDLEAKEVVATPAVAASAQLTPTWSTLTPRFRFGCS
nr:hypothetical protein Iba_chr11aCG10230 [Ipomoea batatas]